jgi:NAD-dependent deacetylase
MPTGPLPAGLLERLQEPGRVVFLCGAGVSAESGVPTFRDAMSGLWARHRPEDLATPDAFRRNPLLVWRWYQARRRQVAAVQPNQAHHALAALQRELPGMTLVTQNVDGLHERAGSTGVLEIHGNLFHNRCRECSHTTKVADIESDTPQACPRCTALMGPDVVWFGEEIPAGLLSAAWRAAASAKLFVSVGTSGLVYPAADLADVARWGGAAIAEINVADTPLSASADFVLREPAAQALPTLLNALQLRLPARSAR